MYKEASRLSLRFQTSKGPLTVEQLWTLSLNDLDALAAGLDTALDKSTKSFIGKKTKEDKLLKLRFDIVIDIINTLLAEQEEDANKTKDKKYNEKIASLILEKEEEELKKLSVDELKAKLVK